MGTQNTKTKYSKTSKHAEELKEMTVILFQF